MYPPCRYPYTGFLFVAAVASGFFVSCEKPSLKVVPPPAKPPPAAVLTPVRFPIDRVIVDQAGRAVDSTIIGRTNTRIFIVRKADGLKASVSFDKLSAADLAFVAALPIQQPPSEFHAKSFGKINEKSGADPNLHYVRSREKEIERLIETNLQLGQEMTSSNNQIEIKTKLSETSKNEKEIARLRSDIDRASNRSE